MLPPRIAAKLRDSNVPIGKGALVPRGTVQSFVDGKLIAITDFVGLSTHIHSKATSVALHPHDYEWFHNAVMAVNFRSERRG